MFESVVNQFATMSLGEEIYTICFTLFFVGGALCCCRRAELTRNPASEAQTKLEKQPLAESQRRDRHKAHSRALPCSQLPRRRTVMAPRLRPQPIGQPRRHAAA